MVQGEELARLVELLSAEPELGYTLEQVVEQALANVPGCEFCAVSLWRDRDIEHATATDPVARELDHRQVVLGEGPGLEVSWDHEIIRIPDLATETRWPRWVRETREAEIGSSLTLLLPVDGRTATLSMYSRRVRAFGQASIDLAAVYARLSGVAVQQAYHSVGLRTALQSRLTIGVAQGILMQRYGISLDRAFEVLRRRSNETNTKLRDVALAIVQQADPVALGGTAAGVGPGEESAVADSPREPRGEGANLTAPASVEPPDGPVKDGGSRTVVTVTPATAFPARR
ncbi:GAF and ANTAR domain-containing protein [Ornithinimicrobium cavernae]|uniref:GAF and ANTAR domain-containing protein n=1 Tax=Ornithinimicrobium cavernae TaxID=2666047 RepID=UPI000D68BE8A|nr:GAF and ANTAR domain-containing protein [Ornithinimicrobium cavernae]